MTSLLQVLIVEDNDFVRTQISRILEKDGRYIPLEAASSEEAMTHINDNNNNIQCMLVDVRMEPEDGFDFLQRIRAADIQTPAILVTGDQNPDLLAKASNMGVNSLLMKPVNKDRLIQMVDRAIAHQVTR